MFSFFTNTCSLLKYVIVHQHVVQQNYTYFLKLTTTSTDLVENRKMYNSFAGFLKHLD